jgi:antitoxin (DNA-binding transcriptional repressor) of toxin-antitoxin stability system
MLKFTLKLNIMKTISVLEMRREFPKLLRWLQTSRQGVRLTYRGKPLADITPVKEASTRPPKEDPFYRIAELAADGPTLTNKDIDEELYGGPEDVR